MSMTFSNNVTFHYPNWWKTINFELPNFLVESYSRKLGGIVYGVSHGDDLTNYIFPSMSRVFHRVSIYIIKKWESYMKNLSFLLVWLKKKKCISIWIWVRHYMILVLDTIFKNKSLHGLGFFFFFFDEYMALVLVTFLKFKTAWICTNLKTLNLSSNTKLQDGKMLDTH